MTKPSEAELVDIEELKRLLARATEGPWEYEPDHEGSGMGWIGRQITAGRGTVFASMFEVEGDSAEQAINAELVVAAVNALPTLLSELEQAREALKAVRLVIEQGYPNKGLKGSEKCEHGRFGFEDCMGCYDEALLAALDEPRTLIEEPK